MVPEIKPYLKNKSHLFSICFLSEENLQKVKGVCQNAV